jgi:L-fuconolactonase
VQQEWPPFAEAAIEPELPVVDAHHHVWDRADHAMATHYPVERLLHDLAGGHNVVGTVYAECSSHFRSDGPEELRPVGETEWLVEQSLPPGVVGAIVGFADLRLGAGVRPVLEAHREAAGDRFAGVRFSTAWDPHPDVPNTGRNMPPGTLLQSSVVEGVRLLGDLDMTLDAWMYFHQIPELVEVAQASPGTRIVLDHLGGPAGIGPYAEDRDAMLAGWRQAITAAARLENVCLKIGGLGFPWFVPDEVVATLGDSDSIAAYWRPEVMHAIEAFGPDRCMFETDFPVDWRLCDYVTLWNAFKKLTADFSGDERADLFVGTATSVYGLRPAD